PDIVARVFELKKNAMVKEIKEGLSGSCVAHIHTIELQKRELPHMHILIFFHHHCRIKDAPDVESIVSVQIPDPVAQSQLYWLCLNPGFSYLSLLSGCYYQHGPSSMWSCQTQCQVHGRWQMFHEICKGISRRYSVWG
ncbi:hypothetical protein J132_09974, partial [Termitomyces sp. J132]